MKKYLNSKWTALENTYGWSHFEVRNYLKKNKKLELFSVCDKRTVIIVDISDISNKNKWVPGWVEIV